MPPFVLLALAALAGLVLLGGSSARKQLTAEPVPKEADDLLALAIAPSMTDVAQVTQIQARIMAAAQSQEASGLHASAWRLQMYGMGIQGKINDLNAGASVADGSKYLAIATTPMPKIAA
jgi:hypothetical protein